MKIFPTNTYHVKLSDDFQKSINLLKANTKESDNLSSQVADKMFIGKVEESGFRIISSETGIGAFTVFKGNFDKTEGVIQTEINRTFKILISILYFLPIIAIAPVVVKMEFIRSIGLIVPLTISFLFIRFILTHLANKFSSDLTMNKLKKLLGIQLVERINA